ncbi:methylated-DNA--[protein]-cysteine S-methyltransferase [Actinocorallia longicatena]|uniref:Methylated-DNA--[protein]-cysteine S-methyltransferase n=1 Tax=Actinocorallia longicatena TaxID=111803 RepID=A0ABP6QHP9_9ACTN
MDTFGWTVLQTPIGPLLLAETENGLVNVHFHAHDPSRQVARLAESLALRPVRGGLCEPIAQLSDYFAGDLKEFSLPLDWRLSAGFNRRILELLYARVPYGQTASYGDLARWSGEPGASRAVGAAMGSNPLPVVVACHRVLNSTGDLGGFGGGRETKRLLLALEGMLPEPLF